MLNPCCCISPRIGCLIFGIIDLIFAISGIASIVKYAVDYGGRYQSWIEIALSVVILILAILLLLGTIQNSVEKLKMWLIVWFIFILCLLAFQIFNIISDTSGRSQERIRMFSSIAGILIFIYEVWVVKAFVTELQYGPGGLTYCPGQVV